MVVGCYFVEGVAYEAKNAGEVVSFGCSYGGMLFEL